MFGTLYVDLIEQLRKTEQCAEVSRRIYAGATFLSIRPRDGWDHKKIDQLIKEQCSPIGKQYRPFLRVYLRPLFSWKAGFSVSLSCP